MEDEKMEINGKRMMERVRELGEIGKDAEGRRTRLAASDEDKAGRDKVVEWMKDAELKVVVDRIGNIFGIWETEENKEKKPIMIGSHIDSVIDAGQYDGCIGVIGGIEVIKRLQETGVKTERPSISNV